MHDDLLSRFWHYFFEMENNGLKLNHSSKKGELAIYLPEFIELAHEELGVALFLPELEKALMQSCKPQFYCRNRAVKSCILKKQLKCFIFIIK